MEFRSFLERLNHEREAYLKECDLCGRCLEVCQVLPYLDLSSTNPVELQEELLDVLRGKQVSARAYTKIFGCTHCASCLHSCPKGLNPYLMQSVLRAAIIAPSQKPQKSSEVPVVRNTHYDLQDVLCGLQLKPSEMRWLREVPSNPRQTDLVLYFGCAVREMPDKILAAMDMVDRLGIDYAAMTGGPTCCGLKDLVFGNITKADNSSRELILALESFRAKKVVFWCGTCYYMFKHEVPRFARLPFAVQNFAEFLCDNLSEFKFVAPLNKTITHHDSCNLGRKGGDFTSIRRLLNAIPGLTLVEMAHNRENSLCCGGATHLYYPEIAPRIRRKRLEEAKNTGADILTSSCNACHLFFSMDEKDYPFEVKNYAMVFAEALGIKYEDKLKKYMKYRSVDKVMEESRECIEASPLTMDQTRKVVSDFFKRPFTLTDER